MNDFNIIRTPFRDRIGRENDFFGQRQPEFFIAPSKKNAETYDIGKIQKMLQQLCQSNMLKQRIALPTEDGLEFIRVNEIMRCEGHKKYTRIYISETKPILTSFNLGKFTKLFEDITVFFLTHKSHLVNINYIKNYKKNGKIEMVDDTIVPVSVRRRHHFLDLITL